MCDFVDGFQLSEQQNSFHPDSHFFPEDGGTMFL
jgi:hypothetical protein